MALRLNGSNQQHQPFSAVSLDGQLHLEDRSLACVVHRVFKRKTAATGVCRAIAAVRQAAVSAAHADITNYLQNSGRFSCCKAAFNTWLRALDRRDSRQQAVVLISDNLVALAHPLLKALSIQHGDMSTRVTDEARALELQCPFSDAFTPDT